MRRATATYLTSGALLGSVSAVAAYGTLSKSSQLFGPTIYRGPGRRRSLALTFDDGPSEGTLHLLDLLDQAEIRATFFLCGKNVQRHPAIAGKVAAAGHEIGNHTYSHPYLPLRSPRFIEREFTETQRIITAETGITPTMLRPPYGLRWFGMGTVQAKLSLLAVLWTVIGNDWSLPARRIVQRITGAITPGGIVCLHDGRAVRPKPNISETLEAVKRLIPVLRDEGYEFETVSGLFS
ncbi:MAG: polysaccharide deacetylase family protein [Acidobacteriaceae bacterium]|nr:polysaccharide deacetylase family protein [Acidobacteriaceae bacterium]